MTVLEQVADLAAAGSPLWSGLRLDEPCGGPRFAGRCPDRYLLGVEAIHEGYLLHYDRARVFAQDDADLALLAGDHLYAAGLAEICRTGDLHAVSALASLISECAANRAEGRGDEDAAAWERTVSALGAATSR
jgi:hypothetical protein